MKLGLDFPRLFDKYIHRIVKWTLIALRCSNNSDLTHVLSLYLLKFHRPSVFHGPHYYTLYTRTSLQYRISVKLRAHHFEIYGHLQYNRIRLLYKDDCRIRSCEPR